MGEKCHLYCILQSLLSSISVSRKVFVILWLVSIFFPIDQKTLPREPRPQQTVLFVTTTTLSQVPNRARRHLAEASRGGVRWGQGRGLHLRLPARHLTPVAVFDSLSLLPLPPSSFLSPPARGNDTMASDASNVLDLIWFQVSWESYLCLPFTFCNSLPDYSQVWCSTKDISTYSWPCSAGLIFSSCMVTLDVCVGWHSRFSSPQQPAQRSSGTQEGL